MADIYYDDKRSPIATSIDELITYFKSFPGTSIVKNVPFILSCPMPALISMQSTNQNLPQFIYKNGLNAANRIYLKSLPVAGGNLNALCNGVTTNSLVPPPVLGSIFSILIVVPIPVLGTIFTTNSNTYMLALIDENGWAFNPTYASGRNNSGNVVLNISTFNPIYNSTGAKDNFTSQLIGSVSEFGKPLNDVTIYSTDNPNMPDSSILQITVDGKIKYTGQPTAENGTGSTIEIFAINYNING